MKFFSISLILFFLISCSDSGQRVQTVRRPYSTSMTVWAIGSGNNREEAELSAKTFLAEMQNGVRFLITRGTFVTKVKNAVLRGALPVSFKQLKDGKIICVLKMINSVSTRYRPFIRSIKLSVPMQSLTENREDFYRQIISDIFKEKIRKRRKVYGAIFISNLTQADKANSLPDRVNLEIKIMILRQN